MAEDWVDVYGRMQHCPECGGPLRRAGTVGYYGNGDRAWVEACARGCRWSQEVRQREVVDERSAD